MRGDLRDLHRPGLEHGLQLLPVAAAVPRDLEEAARGFRISGWQRFWRLEVPFATPGLIWNTMMSMSGGWFFVVASEAISVGNTTIKLPGIGSYIALAIEQATSPRSLYAVGTMADRDPRSTTSWCSGRWSPGPTSSASSRRRAQERPTILALRSRAADPAAARLSDQRSSAALVQWRFSACASR